MKTGGKSAFRQELKAALMVAAADLSDQIGAERLYAFALYTSGQDGFDYVCASANTEEGLTRTAAKYAARKSSYAGEAGRERLRWSASDWEWHDFSELVGGLKLPEGDGQARDRRVYADFVAALKDLDDEGILGKGRRRPILAILCGDMEDAFLERSLRSLNPPAVVTKYREDHTPASYLRELARLPKARRLDEAIGLYRDLALGLDSDRAMEARRRHMTAHDLDAPIRKLGVAASARLLDLVEEVGFDPNPHLETADVGKRRRVHALRGLLATSALFLASETGFTEVDVRRVQGLLARRLVIDRATDGTTPPLAACMGRVLHDLLPDRFPEALQNAKTNRLDNAEEFLLPR